MRNKLVAMLATALAGAGLGVVPALTPAAHASGAPIFYPTVSITDHDDSATIIMVPNSWLPVTDIYSTQPLDIWADGYIMNCLPQRQLASQSWLTTCGFLPDANWEDEIGYAAIAAAQFNVNLGGGTDSLGVNLYDPLDFFGTQLTVATGVINQTNRTAGVSGGNKTINVLSHSGDALVLGGTGNDNITLQNGGATVTADGGDGFDTLRGLGGRDTLIGGRNADTFIDYDGMVDNIYCGTKSANDTATDVVYKDATRAVTDGQHNCSNDTIHQNANP